MKAFVILCGFAVGLAPAQQSPSDSAVAEQPASTATPSAPAKDTPTPFQPPTWSDRRHVFLRRVFGPQAVLETVPGTAFDTARNFPYQWGRTGKGVAKRLGSQYGQFVVGEGIEMGVSALHKEDPRYFRMPDAPFGRRLGHAIVSTVITRGVDGNRTIALSRLANVYGAWAIATTWNPPDQRDALRIFKYGSLGLSLKVAGNVFREFWPDVKQKLRK
ncbi:MAG: hypothetical protein U0R19_05090 [Bryobacteraceae bacterium]